MLDIRWSKIMQEIDRLYWANQTSDGRINCITDYIIRLLNENSALPSEPERETIRIALYRHIKELHMTEFDVCPDAQCQAANQLEIEKQ